MSIASSVAKIGEVIANWLDPKRKELVVLREAIAAAEELLKILRKEGIYLKMPDKNAKNFNFITKSDLMLGKMDRHDLVIDTFSNIERYTWEDGRSTWISYTL
jgi:hypothetical protein